MVRVTWGGGGKPFVLFPNVILFCEVHKICDRLCSEELEGIDDIDLRAGREPSLRKV